jgi:hypothetical protein
MKERARRSLQFLYLEAALCIAKLKTHFMQNFAKSDSVPHSNWMRNNLGKFCEVFIMLQIFARWNRGRRLIQRYSGALPGPYH